MSTQTQTQPAQSRPQIKILSRVASIPLVSSSLESIDNTLSSYLLTRSSYSAAKGLSLTALKYSEPIQIRLAPIITRADGYANQAVDVVQSRYPYPFTAKPEEVTEYVNHSIDEKLKSPAINVATGIDHRFAPIIDYFEVAVNRFTHSDQPGQSTSDTKYQYQRALALSKNLVGYSGDQVKQIHAHSIILQKTTDTANSITTLATSSLSHVQTRVQQLSTTMVTELRNLQTSTVGLSSQIQSRIPPHVKQAFTDISNSLSTTATDLSNTMTAKDIPLQEKMNKLKSQVQERIVPLLDNVARLVGEAFYPKADSPPPSSDSSQAPSEKPLPTTPRKKRTTTKQPVESKTRNGEASRME